MTAGAVWLILAVMGSAMIVDTRAKRVLAAYVIIAAVTSFEAAPAALATLPAAVLFAVAAALKVVVAPVGIIHFLRERPEAEGLRPAAPLAVRVGIALLLLALAAAAKNLPAFAHAAQQDSALFAIMCGIAVLVLHRNVLADLLGLLVFGAGITLEGTLMAAGLPEIVELGAAFDILVTTFIGLALLRALHERGLLDVDSLRRLRG